MICDSGSASAMPRRKPAAAAGHDHHRRRLRRAARRSRRRRCPAPRSRRHRRTTAPGSRRARRPAARRSPRGSRSRGRRRRSRRPQRRVASIFTAGASAGITIVAGDAEPLRRQRHALGMIARRESDDAARPLGLARAAVSRLLAPRSLKLPPCCRHSALIQIRRPAQSSGSSGVRVTMPAMRFAAARDTVRRGSSLRHASLWKTEGNHKSLHGGPTTHISPLRCPMGTSKPQGCLVVNYLPGGPLSCTSIIARWG